MIVTIFSGFSIKVLLYYYIIENPLLQRISFTNNLRWINVIAINCKIGQFQSSRRFRFSKSRGSVPGRRETRSTRDFPFLFAEGFSVRGPWKLACFRNDINEARWISVPLCQPSWKFRVNLLDEQFERWKRRYWLLAMVAGRRVARSDSIKTSFPVRRYNDALTMAGTHEFRTFRVIADPRPLEPSPSCRSHPDSIPPRVGMCR